MHASNRERKREEMNVTEAKLKRKSVHVFIHASKYEQVTVVKEHSYFYKLNIAIFVEQEMQ
jgi:hypothetical protein